MWKLVLSYHVGLRDEIQVAWLDHACLFPMSHLTTPDIPQLYVSSFGSFTLAILSSLTPSILSHRGLSMS